MKLVLYVLCLAIPLMAQEKPQEKICRIAKVEWLDATTNVHAAESEIDNPIAAMAYQTMLGCITLRGRILVIVHSFVNGKPDMVSFVPVEWTIKVTPLDEAKPEEPEPKPEEKK